jgi:hypothetical protein
MIISRQKEFKEILRDIKEQDIFIIGCGKCATKLHVGGEPEVLEMEKRLKRAGKNIAGWTVLSSACNIPSWNDVLSQNPGIEKSDALLVMSCGGGVSVISRFAEAQVYPALDTESLGGVCSEEIIDEQCNMCGECAVWLYGGICPLAQCAKGLLNGPCGGAVEGKCEVDERTCAWDAIYERLKKLGKLEYLEIIHEPKDHTKKFRRQKV